MWRFRSARPPRVGAALLRVVAAVRGGLETIGTEGRVTPEVVRRALASAPKDLPRYPWARRSPADTLRAAQALLDGGPPAPPGDRAGRPTRAWSRAAAPRRGIARLTYHALGQVETLVQAHQLGAQDACLDRAQAIAGDWMADALDEPRDSEVWDDHTTALRAITLCRLWGVLRARDPGESPFAARLLAALGRHGAELADERAYRPTHNHGIVQAYALLALGLVVPDLPGAARWVALAQARLEAQMAANVSPEGHHREHSPAYHFFVLRHLLDAFALARAHGVDLPPRLPDGLRAMLRAGCHLLKPDGTPAALGDTCRSSALLVDPDEVGEISREIGEAFRFCRTGGRQGSAAGLVSTLAHGGGYAFLRGGPSAGTAPRDELYVVVRTATFRTAHAHRDVLSFELYAFGEDLVVDPGGPYAYGSAVRGELMRTAAHNTVTVDDGNQEIGAAEIVRWSTGPTLDVLDARHRLYPEVLHRRLLVLVRPGYLLVVDRLEAERARRFAQSFHLGPALAVTVAATAVDAQDAAAGPAVRLEPLLPERPGLRVERGGVGAHRGWVCTGPEQLVPTSVVRFERVGRVATFATLVRPRAGGRAESVAASVLGVPFESDTRITLRGPDGQDELTIPRDGPVTLSPARPGAPGEAGRR